MDNAKCYGVKCYSEELCKITTAYSTNDVKISLMVRNDINRKGEVICNLVPRILLWERRTEGMDLCRRMRNLKKVVDLEPNHSTS